MSLPPPALQHGPVSRITHVFLDGVWVLDAEDALAHQDGLLLVAQRLRVKEGYSGVSRARWEVITEARWRPSDPPLGGPP